MGNNIRSSSRPKALAAPPQHHRMPHAGGRDVTQVRNLTVHAAFCRTCAGVEALADDDRLSRTPRPCVATKTSSPWEVPRPQLSLGPSTTRSLRLDYGSSSALASRSCSPQSGRARRRGHRKRRRRNGRRWGEPGIVLRSDGELLPSMCGVCPIPASSAEDATSTVSTAEATAQVRLRPAHGRPVPKANVDERHLEAYAASQDALRGCPNAKKMKLPEALRGPRDLLAYSTC